jgi:hypothetical protein
MHEHLELSEAEWELVVELLERERSELPSEIRHTRTSSVRDELRARETMVQGLLERLRRPATA